MGQYSRNGSYDGRMRSMNSYNDPYRMGGMSGRRYYDSEMGNIVHDLENMLETEMNPDKRMAIQEFLGKIQMM